MNFDQIYKLIKLANNNPNDNEANLAARKVCKLLADYKFESVKPVSSVDKLAEEYADLLRKHSEAVKKYYYSEPEWQPYRPKNRPKEDFCNSCNVKAGFDPISHTYHCPKCNKKWTRISAIHEYYPWTDIKW